eukprot:m.163996 g.163996  ORF g.163996 m.163996 type:complete len:938 (+) comp17124_c0_seq1:219-3032(+)
MALTMTLDDSFIRRGSEPTFTHSVEFAPAACLTPTTAFRRSSSAVQPHAAYPKQLLQRYSVRHTIGTGAFAKVKLGVHRLSGQYVAIKIIDRSKIPSEPDMVRVETEITALKRLHHQHVASLYEVLDDGLVVYLVMEYVPGGELFDLLVTKGRCSEAEACRYFRQIVCAVAHCHRKGIAHRDLKPENILLNDRMQVKLVDLGLSAVAADASSLHSMIVSTASGSPSYAAPEVMAGLPHRVEATDIWSLGIVLYALVCGWLPFDNENLLVLQSIINRGEYLVPDFMSPSCEELISRMLQHRPENRISMEELLQHPWLTSGLAGPLDPDGGLIQGREAAAELVLARALSDLHRLTLDEVHKQLDTNPFGAVAADMRLLVRQMRDAPNGHLTLFVPHTAISHRRLSDSNIPSFFRSSSSNDASTSHSADRIDASKGSTSHINGGSSSSGGGRGLNGLLAWRFSSLDGGIETASSSAPDDLPSISPFSSAYDIGAFARRMSSQTGGQSDGCLGVHSAATPSSPAHRLSGTAAAVSFAAFSTGAGSSMDASPTVARLPGHSLNVGQSDGNSSSSNTANLAPATAAAAAAAAALSGTQSSSYGNSYGNSMAASPDVAAPHIRPRAQTGDKTQPSFHPRHRERSNTTGQATGKRPLLLLPPSHTEPDAENTVVPPEMFWRSSSPVPLTEDDICDSPTATDGGGGLIASWEAATTEDITAAAAAYCLSPQSAASPASASSPTTKAGPTFLPMNTAAAAAGGGPVKAVSDADVTLDGAVVDEEGTSQSRRSTAASITFEDADDNTTALPGAVRGRRGKEKPLGWLAGAGTTVRVLLSRIFPASKETAAPRELKGVYSTANTSMSSPSQVRDRLLETLRQMDATVEGAGFQFRVVFGDERSSSAVVVGVEVCRVSAVGVTGVLMRRVKGKVMDYNRLCKDVLARLKL